MVRQGFYTDPAKKHLDVIHDFSGGMNTNASSDTMRVNQSLRIVNADIDERGPIKRRAGMIPHLDVTAPGKAQGYFRFYKNESEYDEIIAVDGRLEKNGQVLSIDGLASFQTDKPIEAVQFQDKLWIATGTKLVEYNGTYAKVVEAYKPQPLEALYIGTNGLAEDPDNYLQDGEATTFRIDGVTFSDRYGVVNNVVTLTAYISKPIEKSVEFQFEYRHTFMEEGKWITGQDWSSSKTYDFKTDTEGDVQFRINMREDGLTVAEAQYLVPKYKIKPVPDPNDVPVNTDYIHKCNRILLHWNRLIMYGDSTQPDAIYISHLNQPNYFPIPNSLRFENGRNEKLTCLVPYRDMLVAFTPTTIQALYGKSPLDFRRITLNTTIGCIAPDSARVVKNHIAFLSFDGVYVLKSVGYTEDKANVERIDNDVQDVISLKENACATVQGGYYHLTFPDENRRVRYLYETGAWVYDDSPKIDFQRMYTIDNVLYGQSQTGKVLKFDRSTTNDDGYVFKMVFSTRLLDFNQPYHIKKMKEVQFITSPKHGTTSAKVYVFADMTNVLTADSNRAEVDEEGNVVWVAESSPNLIAQGGTVLGQWSLGNSPFGTVELSVDSLAVSGKCHRARLEVIHDEDTPFKLLGLGFIFKLKRP